MNPQVFFLQHPLIQHKLTQLRARETAAPMFRMLVRELSLLLAYEVTRALPTVVTRIETPLESMDGVRVEEERIVLVPILRAGLGMLEGFQELIPGARVGHIGLYRDPATLDCVEYYFKLPDVAVGADLIVLDPMLATGNSLIAAVHRLKEFNPGSLRAVSILASPEGLSSFHAEHPDIPVFTAAVDRCLNEHGYILPGLGDAGDRLFGTK